MRPPNVNVVNIQQRIAQISLDEMYNLVVFSLVSLISAQPQPCFLKCKDNYMNAMQGCLTQSSPEWNIDMVTPLNALLSQNSNQKHLVYQIDGICRLSTTYQRCLAKCPQSPAKRILLRGQKAWNIICHDFKNNSDFHSRILPCWSTSGSALTKSCTPMAQNLQAEIVQLMEGGVENLGEGMDALCRSVHSYDTCFVMKNYEICGLPAAKFLIKLTHQTSHAFVELLDEVLSLKILPRSCLDWLNHKYASVSSPRAIAKRMKVVSKNTITFPFFAIVLLKMFVLP